MSDTSSRPHRASRIEDRVYAVVARFLRRKGWRARVEPYTGYGLAQGPSGADDATPDGWVRVLGRVMLSPATRAVPEVVTEEPERHEPTARPEDSAPEPASKKAVGPGRAPARSTAPAALRAVRGWRSFFTAQLPHAEVEILVGGAVHRVAADRGGYVDHVVPANLPAGWHDVEVRPVGGPSVSAPVRVLAADEHVGMVSDIDDTVMVTALPRPLVAAWNSLVLHEDARRPVKGMADLYAQIEAEHHDIPVLYLSTGAWNVAPALRRFLAHHRYPAGPLLLTDWGPTNTGWFRSGQDHKRRTLARLAEELPHVRWLLVGDDGQHDPVIYGDFTDEHPDHVRAVAIRQLSAAQQVFAHGAPTPTARSRKESSPDVGDTVPVVAAPDGQGLGRELRKVGVLSGPTTPTR